MLTNKANIWNLQETCLHLERQSLERQDVGHCSCGIPLGVNISTV